MSNPVQADVDIKRAVDSLILFAIKSKRTIGDAMIYWAKGYTRDVLKITPPMGSLAGRESFAAQRKIGQKAVRRDIGKIFNGMESLGAYNSDTRFGKRFTELVNQRNSKPLGIMLANAGYAQDPDQVMDAPDPAYHQKYRSSRGRVRAKKKNIRQIYTWARPLERYIKLVEKQVGKLKAGFVAAATHLGISVPAWIKAHSNNGAIIDKTRQSNDPEITIRNTVKYASSQNFETRFQQIAVRNQTGKIERQLDAKLKGNWSKNWR